MDGSLRNEIDALTCKLLQAADVQHEAGDTNTALLSSDAAEALLALLDYEAVRPAAGHGETGATC